MQPSAEHSGAKTLASLTQVPGLLAALSAAERQAISAYFTVKQVAPGSELWRVGEPGGSLACILDGSIELKVDTEFPGKQIVVGVFSAGTVIGARCVLDDLPHATTARVLESTTVLFLSRENFTALTTEQPQIGVKLLKGILRAETHRLRSVYARLASIF